MSDAQILATGEVLVGGGLRSIESVMEELVRASRTEIQFASFVITSGRILQLLEQSVARGVRVTVVVNRLEENPTQVQVKLRELAEAFPHFNVASFFEGTGSVLHAKVIVGDRQRAIVGSANLTTAAMVSNYEIAMLARGSVAGQLAELLDSIFQLAKAAPDRNTDTGRR